MITIFYCTKEYNKEFDIILQKSCANKNNQIICYTNKGLESLTECYNKGLVMADNEIVVFIHDDIFLEYGWDIKIKNYFEKNEHGIIGMAGTQHLTTQGTWWHDKNKCSGIVAHPHNNKSGWIYDKWSGKTNEFIQDVVAIDGLFIACHKGRIKFNFDESYDGFHFYDIPFCTANYLAGVKVGVVTDIDIKHKSRGNLTKGWYLNRKKFTNQYKNILPLKVKHKPHVKNINVKINKHPKISIIIPSKNNFKYLNECVKSLIKTNYDNYEIIIADTGSNKQTFTEYTKFDSEKIKIIKYDYCNLSKINNDVVKKHTNSELILFCKDNVKMINDVISLMVSTYNKNKNKVGTIGCRLLFNDNTIKHGGIALVGGKTGLSVTHKGLNTTYFCNHTNNYDVIGCTGTFLMVNRDLFIKVGMFNEQITECFEDVLLNFDMVKINKKNIYLGVGVCYHDEAINKKNDILKKKRMMEDYNNILKPFLLKNFNILSPYLNKR